MKTNLSDVYTVVIERGVTRCNEVACIEHMGEELWQTAKDEIIPQLEEISSDYQIPLMIITKMALKKICEWAQLAQPRKINKKGKNTVHRRSFYKLFCLRNHNLYRKQARSPICHGGTRSSIFRPETGGTCKFEDHIIIQGPARKRFFAIRLKKSFSYLHFMS